MVFTPMIWPLRACAKLFFAANALRSCRRVRAECRYLGADSARLCCEALAAGNGAGVTQTAAGLVLCFSDFRYRKEADDEDDESQNKGDDIPWNVSLLVFKAHRQ